MDFRIGDRVIYPREVGDIPAGSAATMVENYGLGSYLVELESGRKYYAHSGEVVAADRHTIDALAAALEDSGKWLAGQPARSTCRATTLTELTESIDAALALARGGK